MSSSHKLKETRYLKTSTSTTKCVIQFDIYNGIIGPQFTRPDGLIGKNPCRNATQLSTYIIWIWCSIKKFPFKCFIIFFSCVNTLNILCFQIWVKCWGKKKHENLNAGEPVEIFSSAICLHRIIYMDCPYIEYMIERFRSFKLILHNRWNTQIFYHRFAMWEIGSVFLSSLRVFSISLCLDSKRMCFTGAQFVW